MGWLDFFGGNSTKATSGINGALTRTQVDEKIGDSVKQFYDDTLKSARDKARPDLIKVLTYKSAAAVEWLQDVFNLDLTLVSRLGYVFPQKHLCMVKSSGGEGRPSGWSDAKMKKLKNLQRPFPPKNPPWPRCQVSGHGDYLCSHAAPGRIGRE